jgi:hypothetical protein
MAAVFGPSHGMASPKIPAPPDAPREFRRGRPFSLVRSFGPAKEMNSRDSAKAFDLDLPLSEQSQKLSPEGELLSLLVQRK